jgi:putative cardiolipin synthase
MPIQKRSACWRLIPFLKLLWLSAFSWLLMATTGCASFSPGQLPTPTFALSKSEVKSTRLGKLMDMHAELHPGQSGFELILNGESAFKTRAALADAAQQTLDLQYYSVGDDLTTDLLLTRIVLAAQRGVRVRILLDDAHGSARLFARRAFAADPRIQIRLFNPLRVGVSLDVLRWGEFLFDSDRLNRRMHNKLWLTDNAVAITGSRNLADEYFSASEASNFYDVDLLAVGPIVKELSEKFDAYWNNRVAVPFEALSSPPVGDEAQSLRMALEDRTKICDNMPACKWLDVRPALAFAQNGICTLTWARAQLQYDEPDKAKEETASGIQHGSVQDFPGGARTVTELLIISPYFIPGERGRHHLSEMRDRGVRVAVLTNSLASTDSVAAHAGYARHRFKLLMEGVELFETRPETRRHHRFKHRWEDGSASSLHAKVIVQDRARAIIGSLNQDPRSRLYNTEAWIFIESEQLAGELAALFDEGTEPMHAFKVDAHDNDGREGEVWTSEEDGSLQQYYDEPMSSPWQRFWRDVLGVVIPERLL